MPEFWKSWKRKSKLEVEAIKVIRKGKKLILDSIPKEKIFAIYLKGSFVRREMNKYSDVDFVVILKDNRYLGKMRKLKEKRQEYKPDLCLSWYSLKELKENRQYTKTKEARGRPDTFTRNIKTFKLIYGKEVDVKDFARKSDKEKLKGLVRAFGKVFFPLYESGSKECGFSMLVKQTFWLAELELRIKGERVPGTWGGMGRKFGKDHIIQDALRFRVKKNKDKKVRRDYIKRLKRYLKSLEKLL